MGKKNIGLFFEYNENWIGGTYYLLNLIHALKLLPEDQCPEITILSPNEKDFVFVKKETGYKFLSYRKYPKNSSRLLLMINKFVRKATMKDSFLVKTNLKNIDFVYPNYSEGILNKNIPKVYWIPDFQDEFLPHLFTDQVKNWRKTNRERISKTGDLIVFSSKDSLKHFQKLYPNSKIKTEVLPFAVSHPSFQNLNSKAIKKKYSLPEKYLFAPNQFWQHKNHIVVLKALSKAKEGLGDLKVVFSGNENTQRAPRYFESLKAFVKDNQIEDKVIFLGFIDRNDQLKIMEDSHAVLQPSTFEGWSTVVEDAKAMGKLILLSDLEVHKEQMVGRKALFFPPNDEEKLLSLIKEVWLNDAYVSDVKVYQQNRMCFAQNFMDIVNNYTSK